MQLLMLLSVAGCSDYDLHREEKPVPAAEDTAEPVVEPTESPDISIEPAVIDFGSILKDCAAEPLEVVISNVGLADLVISDISFEGNGDTAFSHGADAFFTDSEITLAYGDSISFYSYFTPALYLDYELELKVQSNDPDESMVAVPTLGTGAAGALFEEGFTQEYNPVVDVLWVVDNSGSMETVVENVRSNFEFFITEFLTLGLDYHMAAITTDMDDGSQSGQIQGEVLLSSMSSSYVEGNFLSSVDVGSGGSADEEGFNATKAALTSPLVNGANAGFLRDYENGEEVGLTIIVVSDENDNSSMDASSYVTWLKSLKDDPTKARFNAFIDTGGGDPFGVNYGAKYIEAANSTDGFVTDIYSENYEAAMQEISFAAAGMVVSFTLERTPMSLSTMKVYANGQEVPQDLYNGWTYDSASNSLTFHGDSIPEPGASVTIQYEIETECQ
jgi:hypothetical protein